VFAAIHIPPLNDRQLAARTAHARRLLMLAKKRILRAGREK